MKAVEFDGTVTPTGEIVVPPEIADQVPSGESLHIVLQWETADEDAAWRAQGRKRFEAAYAPEDSIYEQLMDETPAR
ncbi:MAG TPA: hypothetical protein VNU44_11655 [Bryobacteraceae bacterium]|nr:hypothetical protein [Bryobacteraceae bacterium]